MSDDAPLERQRVLIAGLWSASSIFVPLIGTAVLSVVMGRVLGPSLLGQQSLIAYVEATIAALLIGALTDTAIRSLSASVGAGEMSEVVHLERWTTLSVATSGLATGILVSGVGLFTDDPGPWLVAGLTSTINGVGWSYGARIIARDGWSPVATRRLLWQTVAQALGVVAVLAGLGIMGVFWSNAIAAAGVAIMLRRVIGGVQRGPLLPFPRSLVRLWLSFVLVELLTQVVSKRIEFVFLGVLSTTAQIAMYSIPFMIVSSAALLPTSVFIAGMPSVAASAGAGRLDRTSQSLGPALRVTLLLSPPMAAAVTVLGPRLIVALYGSDFTQAAALVPVLALSLLLTPVADVCTAYWLGAGRTRHLVVAVSIGGLVDLVLALALIGQYGAWGAAIANTAGQSLAAGLLVVATWRALRLDGFPWARWTASIVVSGAAVAAGWAFLGLVPSWGGLVLGTAFLALALGAYGWLIGFVRGGDAQWLRDSVPTRLRLAARVLSGPSSRALEG